MIASTVAEINRILFKFFLTFQNLFSNLKMGALQKCGTPENNPGGYIPRLFVSILDCGEFVARPVRADMESAPTMLDAHG